MTTTNCPEREESDPDNNANNHQSGFCCHNPSSRCKSTCAGGTTGECEDATDSEAPHALARSVAVRSSPLQPDPSCASAHIQLPSPSSGTCALRSAAALLCRHSSIRSAGPGCSGERVQQLLQQQSQRQQLYASAPNIHPQNGVMGNAMELLQGLSQLQFLSRGAYACVYTGRWQGQLVAVKLLACRTLDHSSPVLKEALLGRTLQHPNVVTSYLTRVARFDEQALRAAWLTPAPQQDPQQQQQHHPLERVQQQDPALGQGEAASGSCSPVGSRSLARRSMPNPTVSLLAEPASARAATPRARAAPQQVGMCDSGHAANVLGDVLRDLGVAPGMYVCACVMEYCSMGSLEAMSKRADFDPSSNSSSSNTGSDGDEQCAGPALQAERLLLRVAKQVAMGLAYLHANGLMHGDVKPANVLLQAVPPAVAAAEARAMAGGYGGRPASFDAPPGPSHGCSGATRFSRSRASLDAAPPDMAACCRLTAKLADFGLSGVCEDPVNGNSSSSKTMHIGTVAYAAPERFDAQRGPPSDIYSFGVLLWQMASGRRPYEGLLVGQVVLGKCCGTLALQWPAGRHAALQPLCERCMAQDPALRPTAEQAVVELASLERQLWAAARDAASAGAGAPARPLAS